MPSERAVHGDSPYFTLIRTPAENPVALPETGPTRPPGVDQVWVQAGNRVVRWRAAGGWIDVS